MKTLLIFPPVSDPIHPPLGIAKLCGFLREIGEDIKLLDLNIQSYYFLLSKSNLKKCLAKINKQFKELEAQKKITIENAKKYAAIAECLIRGDYLVKSMAGALAALKDSATYQKRELYGQAAAIVKHGMKLVSVAHYPTQWSLRGYNMSYSSTLSSDVLEAVKSKRENLFIPFFKAQLPKIARADYKIIGISINYYCQLIPAMTLASLLKNAFPNTIIVIGGALVRSIYSRDKSLNSFKHIVDCLVPYEGELPLLDLIQALKQGTSLIEIPGLIWLRAEKSGVIPLAKKLTNNPSSIPNFADLPLASYLSPRLVIPYYTSKGCYWAQCTFCTQHLNFRYLNFNHGFVPKKVADILAELKILSKRYNAIDFYFVDEAIPVKTARQLARRIKSENLPYRWFGQMKFEPAMSADYLAEIRQGGCQMIFFGLESSVPRVLELMKKGIDPELASNIIKRCHKLDIKVFIMFFIGFPSETKEEAECTARFIEDHSDYICRTGFTNFVLSYGSMVQEEAQRFGVVPQLKHSGDDLAHDLDYKVVNGISQKEAEEMVEVIKNRPIFRSLLKLPMIAPSHFAFLPRAADTNKRDAANLESKKELSGDSHLKLSKHLIFFKTEYNLETIKTIIKKTLTGTKTTVIKKKTANYIYNPLIERMSEVGADGYLLLQLCDGQNSLTEILSMLGPKNQKAALDFYMPLYRQEYITE